MKSIFKLVACLFVLLSFNAKALVVNGCTIEPYTYCVGADLTFANLSEANLTFAYLSEANLTGAVLSDADLSYADLFEADLSDANLTNADLSGAYLSNAILSYANLSGADLYDALYNGQTVFPTGFDPITAGMSYVPVPAAAWLFGSALVGLGLIRKR